MAQTKLNTTQIDAAVAAHIASTANPHSVTAAQAAAIPNDGWISVSWSTPTRTSASVFTVAVDVTGIIQKGYKLKFTDTTTKYAVVKSVTYGAGVSTITIYVNTDYTIVGNPSAISWSNINSPFGFPGAFNFSTTVTSQSGSGGTVSVTSAKYTVIATELASVIIRLTVTNKGTAAGSLDCSIPFTIAGPTIGVGSEVAVTATMLQVLCITGLTRLVVYTYNVGTPWTLNWDIEINSLVSI